MLGVRGWREGSRRAGGRGSEGTVSQLQSLTEAGGAMVHISLSKRWAREAAPLSWNVHFLRSAKVDDELLAERVRW